MEGPKEAGVEGCRGEQEATPSRGLTWHLRIKQQLQVQSALTREPRTAAPQSTRTAVPARLGWVPPRWESELNTTQAECSPKSHSSGSVGIRSWGALSRASNAPAAPLPAHREALAAAALRVGVGVAAAHSPWK